MRHKYIVGICLLSCFLLSSTAFVGSVQANEVKEALEEKLANNMKTLGINFFKFNMKNIMNTLIKIVLTLIYIVGYIILLCMVLFYETWSPYGDLTFEELIIALIYSLFWPIELIRYIWFLFELGILPNSTNIYPK